jgi:hypothetical protein
MHCQKHVGAGKTPIKASMLQVISAISGLLTVEPSLVNISCLADKISTLGCTEN